jgi:predicted ATPase/DNA-binding SARP family transcriptional activator
VLRVQLLGGGRIFDDAAEIKLPSRTWTLPLLAFLLIHRGEVIPRSRLAFTLWPDEPEETALRNLRRNLHRLVKALPPIAGASWVTLDGHTIAWNESSPFELDVGTFERLRGDNATLDQAVAAYAGDFLSEIDDDWVAVERERLRLLYFADLSSLVAVNRSRRAFPAAAGYAQQLLAADPWHEDALRQLMAVRYDAGDAAGALAAFDRFSRRLRAEMNVDPMPETLALRDAVARGLAIPSALDATEFAAKRTPDPSPFVGRSEELERLRAQWSRAARGNGSMTLVRGAAGIGKSRLVAELALIAEAEGGRVIAGTTSLPERDPYQSLSMALRDALPLLAGITLAPPLLAVVAELVPELRGHLQDIPPVVRLNPENERARLIDALTQVLAALAKPRPLLVILEDLHRAGAATIEGIAAIAPRLARSHLLIVATYRQEDISRTHPIRALEHALQPLAERVDVGPLTASDVGLLVEALAPRDAASSQEFVASLTRRSEGNPLFVTELLRDAERAGPESRPAIPPSVAAMMSERISSLSPATRAVAEIAATAGEAFTVDIVRDIAGLPESALLDGIDELLDRHLVRESTERGRYEYAFTHHLIHAAIYGGVPADAKARRHRRIARMLAATIPKASDDRAAEIALHFERGGDAATAAAYYATAARRAARLNANAEARDLISRAQSLDDGEDRARFDLLLLRSRMHARLGDAGAESADLAELETVAARVDPDAVCTVLASRIDLAARLGDVMNELAAIECLTEHAASAAGAAWRGQALEARARRLDADAQYERAIETAVDARRCYDLLGDRVAGARVTAFAARVCTLVPERARDAEALVAEAVKLAERSGDAGVLMRALRHASGVAQERHDYVRAAELARSALTLCLEIGDRWAEPACRNALGVAAWGCWQIDEALQQFREALCVCEALQRTRAIDIILCDLGGILVDVGDFAGAIEWCWRAADATLPDAHASTAAVALVNAADAAWQGCDMEAMATALEHAATLVAMLPESRFLGAFVQNRGRLLRCRRDFTSSAEELERAFVLYERTGRWANAVEALDDLALTCLGRGQTVAARDALSRGAEIVQGRSRFYPIRAAWIDACVHHASGDGAAAQRALQEAHEVFVRQRNALVDPALRASFEAIPVHRALRAARERDEWPPPGSPCVVAFPFTDGTKRATARSR